MRGWEMCTVLSEDSGKPQKEAEAIHVEKAMLRFSELYKLSEDKEKKWDQEKMGIDDETEAE